MTTQLITLISIHVFALLIAASAFYALWLLLLAKRGADKKALLSRSGIGAFGSITAWSIYFFFLGDYYLGKAGFITPPDVTSLIPTLTLLQTILLPLLAVISIIILVLVWKKGAVINPKEPEQKNGTVAFTAVLFTAIATIGAVALAFFGVMVP